MNRKKNKTDSHKKNKEENRGKIIIPYIRGVSENLARIFKRHNIEAIHKPSTTIKNILCSKMKDKVEDLDRTGAVYYNKCKKHIENEYVGETERVFRERLYEHRVIDHKTSTKAASIEHPEDRKEDDKREPSGLRRSKRNVKRKDYKTMHEGTNQPLTEGSTEFSAHV